MKTLHLQKQSVRIVRHEPVLDDALSLIEAIKEACPMEPHHIHVWIPNGVQIPAAYYPRHRTIKSMVMWVLHWVRTIYEREGDGVAFISAMEFDASFVVQDNTPILVIGAKPRWS